MLPKSSRTNVDTLPFIPMRMLTLVKTTYAVLGILKKNDAGYIRGVMDHLDGHKEMDKAFILVTYFWRCNTSIKI